MTQPRAYTQTTTFTDHSTVSPADPHSGTDLDTEFVELKQNLDDLNTNIALLQRDDGKLINTAVHKDAFNQDALALIGASGSGFTPKGDWATATAYVAGDLVTNNAATYLTITESHTSGDTFAGDLSTYWTLIANSAIETSSASVNMYSGDGNETEFATTYTYAAVGDIQVFVNGALQATNLYTISNNSGNNITFTTAPSAGTNNVIIWGDSIVAQQAKAATLTYRDTTNNHKITAERWSDKVDGSVVDAESGTDSSEYSSKAYAIGGTGVTSVSGSAKQWALGGGASATEATEVISGLYSARRYASLAAADLVLTNADVVSTNADVVLTNQDTIDTAADLVATNQDTIDTAADLVATNQDTIDTAADRVQTGLDRVATAADKVATNADVVLTAADVVSAEADKVQTGLDRIATAADVVSTAASASAAATSETNAATSAANAATSYDSFDDRYLGSKSSNPTEDNDAVLSVCKCPTNISRS